MTTDADKLIYENANKYRLHADSIRWTLLGGYVAFFPALFGLAKSDSTATAISKPEITLLIALLSLAYLWILSFQNWLYNRYAGWVDECEYRLTSGKRLRSLQDFSKETAPYTSPFHPAFFMAQLITGSVAYYFLAITVINVYIQGISEFLRNLPAWLVPILWISSFMMYFGILNFALANWYKIIGTILRRLSNIYSPSRRINREDSG